MAILAEIKAVFDASSALKAKSDIDQLKDASPQAASALGTLEQAASALKNPLIAAASALAAASGAMIAMGFEAINAADNLRDLSIGSGTASSELQALSAVAEKSGSSLESLQTGLDFIAKGMAKGEDDTKKFTKALDYFGVSMKKSNGEMKTTEELAQDVAKAYSETANSSSKSAAAADALGANYKKLIPTYLELGNKQDELNYKYEVGAIKSKALQDASDEYNDSLVDIKSIMEGVGNYAASSMLPLLQGLATWFKQSATNGGLLEGALNLMKIAFSGIVGIVKGAVAVLMGLDTTFAILGKSLGAFMAMVAAIGKGDFGAAKNIFKDWKADVSSLAEDGGARISKMFTEIEGSAKKADTAVTNLQKRGDYKSTNDKKEKKAPVEKDPIEEANKALLTLIDSLEESNKKIETGSKLEEMALRIQNDRYKQGSQLNKDKVLALAAENDKLKENAILSKNLIELSKMGDDIVDSIEDELLARTMTNAEFRKTIQLRAIEIKQKEQLAEVNKNVAGSEARIKQINDEAEAQKQRVIEANDKVKKSNEDWIGGAKTGLIEYAESIGNVAKNTEEMMVNSLKGAEDALVQLVTTGKANFGDLARSIIADLARMAIRALMTKAIMAFVGTFSAGAPMEDGAVIPNATGDIYNSPTLFPMANGSTGMLGEAGPEAIMPLTRMPNGKLGVASHGGGGGVHMDVGGIYINVNGGGGGGGNAENDNKLAKSIGDAVEVRLKGLINSELRNQSRPGNSLNPTQTQATW